MNTHLHFHLTERGVTALEAAIILIAFVVSATLFAFTILSSGTFLTERSQESAVASLAQVRGAIELTGGVVAHAHRTGHDGTLATLSLTLSNVAGGQPVDFNTAAGQRVVQVELRDQSQRVAITDWTIRTLGYDDGDRLLEERELFELTIPTSNLPHPIGPNHLFTLEIKPPIGAPLRLQRTTPATIDSIMELH